MRCDVRDGLIDLAGDDQPRIDGKLGVGDGVEQVARPAITAAWLTVSPSRLLIFMRLCPAARFVNLAARANVVGARHEKSLSAALVRVSVTL